MFFFNHEVRRDLYVFEVNFVFYFVANQVKKSDLYEFKNIMKLLPCRFYANCYCSIIFNVFLSLVKRKATSCGTSLPLSSLDR